MVFGYYCNYTATSINSSVLPSHRDVSSGHGTELPLVSLVKEIITTHCQLKLKQCGGACPALGALGSPAVAGATGPPSFPAHPLHHSVSRGSICVFPHGPDGTLNRIMNWCFPRRRALRQSADSGNSEGGRALTKGGEEQRLLPSPARRVPGTYTHTHAHTSVFLGLLQLHFGEC